MTFNSIVVCNYHTRINCYTVKIDLLVNTVSSSVNFVEKVICLTILGRFLQTQANGLGHSQSVNTRILDGLISL